MRTITGKQGKKVWQFYLPVRKHLNIGILLLLNMFLFASCLDPTLETVVDYEESFSEISSIAVDAGSLPVHYVGNPDLEEVHLDALLRTNTNADRNIAYRLVEDKLIVSLEQAGLGRGRLEGHILLTGPVDMSLQLVAGSGEVRAENVRAARIHLEVNSGHVRAKDLEAQDLYLAASSGEVLGENLSGNTIADLSSGRLVLDQLDGNLEATSSSGNMKLKHISGLLHAELSSGNMDMEHVAALGNVRISSGKVNGRNIGLCEYTYFKASSGDISIQTNSDLAAFNYDIHTGSGRVKVGESESSGTLKIMNGAPHTIRGEVNSGKIEIIN
ncbi:Putative adhesin [Cyclobacterium lianum]|uniref:Putative adhesin n=1 Tax=Cyclobacterium lianum TaxID=388280 RepID=A0A1M7NYB1_9BACT|nr:DUF4097 family beta strand repeat-containing protein [Cyclobacterium lianum]SHN09132.1 Putative adhesin [Cyclobacterium lianum]